MHDTDEVEPAEVEEVIEVVTTAKLMTEVVTTAAPITTAAQVPKPSALRKRRGVVIQDPEETAATLIIMHSKDEEFARQLEAELNANINWKDVLDSGKEKNMAGFKMEFFKGMTYNEIRSIFEKHYNSIKAFLEKELEEVTEQEEGSKRKVNDNDDDVYTEATPIASKNFNREDLEAFWKLVKERFKSTEPKNFSDDFLLNTLKIMFEKPNVKANIILLVKKKYLLTHFTLEQMLNNVRLKVKEESEMSLELLSESVTSVSAIATNKVKTSELKPKSISEPLIKDYISDSEDENENETKSKKRKPSFTKVEFVKPNKQVKSPRESVKQEEQKRQAKHPRKNSQSPRGLSMLGLETKHKVLDHVFRNNGASITLKKFDYEKGFIISRYSRHMTGNMSYLSEYEEIDGGYVAFGGDPKGGKITGKGKISIGGLTYLFAKATLDESNQWHRRLGHINFKTMNKLLYEMKGIKREFSIARTLRQNGIAKRKNKTPIEAARTMLADSKIPTTFWAKVVNTACYVQNRVLVIKPHNKTPYKLFLGRKPALSFMRPFGCHVIILNTIDHLGKFDGKADEGLFIRYSTNSKAFRVFNNRTRIVEENLHVKFSENTPNIAESGPNWLFDIHALTKSMNYKPVVVGIQSNGSTCKARVETDSPGDGFKPSGEEEKKDTEDLGNKESEVPITKKLRVNQKKDSFNSTNRVSAVSSTVNAASNKVNAVVSPIPITRIHKDHPVEQIIRDIHSTPQTRMMTKSVTNHEEVYVYQPTVFEDPEFPDKFYKVDNALYGLHQAPRAWSPRKEMCTKFEKMIHKKFQMSSMGVLTFFLGLQVTQKNDGIFISQDKSMIGSLMYLTSSRPDIMFVVCACARFQVTPKVSHLHAVKRIFRYLKGQPKLGLWYPKDSPFDLEAYTDSDYDGASLDRKSTKGGCQFLRSRLISWQCKKQTIVANSTTKAKLYTNNDCNEGKQLLRMELRLTLAYTYYCQLKVNAARRKLTTAVDAKNINREAYIHAKVDEKRLLSLKQQLGEIFSLKMKEELTAYQMKSSLNNFHSWGLTRRGGQELILKRLYKIGLSARVESYAKEQSLDEEDASKQGRNIADIDENAETTLVNETAEDQGRYDDQEMFDTNITTTGIKEIVSTAALITTADVTPDKLTIAQALVEIKKSKPKGETTTTTVIICTPDSTRLKARGVVMQDPSETPTTTTIPKSSKVQDKGKDYKLAARLQEEEQGELTIEEKSRLFVELVDKRKKHFAKLRVEEQRRKPPTKAQKRNQMCKEFDKTMSWINSFVPIDSEPVKDKAVLTQESSSKRAGDKLDQGRSKKQKVEDDKEQEKLKRCLEIILNDGDDVTHDATPLSIKTSIIDYKIYKEGKKSYFQIFKADGNSQMYYTFSKMLKNFDKEDIKVLWRLVKDRFIKSKPVDDMDSFLLHTLKTMFEHHVEDIV
nr:uncharacterized mitochondrial protein AtMg00810-like [Tanacetum cinerariifolium]